MMSTKLHVLLFASIMSVLVVDKTVGMPNIAHTEPNPVEDTALNIDGAREKRQNNCGWHSGCSKGYCWATCVGAFLSK